MSKLVLLLLKKIGSNNFFRTRLSRVNSSKGFVLMELGVPPP